MKRVISDGQKRLTCFVDGVLYEKSPRRIKMGFPRSDIRFWFRGSARFAQLQLKDAQSEKRDALQSHDINGSWWNPSKTFRERRSYPLLFYSETPVICRECGRFDVIGHGPRRSEWRGGVARWKCKSCGGTFTWDVASRLKFPLSLWDVVISSFLDGFSFTRMNEEVSEKASRYGINSISSDAVYSIIKRSCQILAEFEKFAIRNLTGQRIKLKTVEIDFSPYILYIPKSGGRQFTLEKKPVDFSNLTKSQLKRVTTGKPVEAYLTGTLERECRYIPSVITGWGFNHKYSLKCLWKMLETMGSKPEVIVSDGFRGHIKAVKMLFPDVKLISRTKKQDYGIVNFLERLWGELKSECLHKYRFRSFNTLPYAVELKRLEHNLLRPHTSLEGQTPAQFLRIGIPGSIVKNKKGRWERLLKLAYHMVMTDKAVNKRKRLE